MKVSCREGHRDMLGNSHALATQPPYQHGCRRRVGIREERSLGAPGSKTTNSRSPRDQSLQMRAGSSLVTSFEPPNIPRYSCSYWSVDYDNSALRICICNLNSCNALRATPTLFLPWSMTIGSRSGGVRSLALCGRLAHLQWATAWVTHLLGETPRLLSGYFTSLSPHTPDGPENRRGLFLGLSFAA